MLYDSFILELWYKRCNVIKEITDLLLLTHETPKLPSYRNQSIDLPCKSIGWFLYDGNFGV